MKDKINKLLEHINDMRVSELREKEIVNLLYKLRNKIDETLNLTTQIKRGRKNED